MTAMPAKLTPAEIRMMKMLQANPELLARVQDPNSFSSLQEETRLDRNHRFILSAIDATERTNWDNDEREAQDEFISEVTDLLDEVAKVMRDRFKVKSNEKGEAWHALSFLTEHGQTLKVNMQTDFGHKPNKVWGTVETVPVPKASKSH